MIPSASTSSSTVRTAWVMCCHWPRGSVNRKSTNWTSFFSIVSKTLSASLIAPLHRPLGLSSARPPFQGRGALARLYGALIWLRGRVRQCGFESRPRPAR